VDVCARSPVASLVDQTGLIWLGRNYPVVQEAQALVLELHHREDECRADTEQ
jgi:hypothetical protein